MAKVDWKANRQVYNTVMNCRHTDILSVEQIIDEIGVTMASVNRYLFTKEMVFGQPTKSRLVAIIYAYCMVEYFGIDLYESLDDPELLTDDKYFLPYRQAKAQYDYIIDTLGEFQKWKDSPGWVKRTRLYFWMECTDEGLDFAVSATDEEILDFLDAEQIPPPTEIYNSDPEEPGVRYELRMRPTWIDSEYSWLSWEACSRDRYDELAAKPRNENGEIILSDWQYQARKLSVVDGSTVG